LQPDLQLAAGRLFLMFCVVPALVLPPARLQAAPLFPQLLRRALALVHECPCSGRAGCPACVQHTECGEYNSVLHKRAAAVVLQSLLEGEEADEPQQQPAAAAEKAPGRLGS
jgi:ATP-dependent helicase YprA (DUF1998 family)